MSGIGVAGPVKRPSVGLLAVLGLIIAGLAALDKSLERIETADLSGIARRDFSAGSRLLEAGRPEDAIDSLRSAHALARDNRDYELQLIVALMAAGKTGEADPLMSEALQRAPNDGRANLIAARLANREGSYGSAAAYYHRAIYGEWPAGAADPHIAARMELIGFLREKGSKQELLGELISLEAEAPADPAMQRSLAHLLLVAGAPGRAADIYRTLTGQDPKDTAAYAGLGEAELEQGRYSDAHAAFVQAFFHTPADAAIRVRLQLLNTVMALDPTPRELPAAEKFQRSMRILDLARASLEQCAARAAQSGPGDAPSLMARADDALAAKTPGRVTNELSEKILGLAQEMWRSRVKACGGIPSSEDPLRLIMEKLAA